LVIQGLQDFAEVFGIDVARPPMKTKQIPDDFRDWIEARTFEIAVDSIATPVAPGLVEAEPLLAKPQRALPLAKLTLEAHALGNLLHEQRRRRWKPTR
jgi:hypothetical protein